MFYAKILNGRVVEYPCDTENITAGECVEVQITPLPNSTIEQNVVFDGIECVEGMWRQKWRVEPATEQQIQNRTTSQIQFANMTFEQLAAIDTGNL